MVGRGKIVSSERSGNKERVDMKRKAKLYSEA